MSKCDDCNLGYIDFGNYFKCKGNGCEKEVRADERAKAFKEFVDLYREFCKAPSDESCLKEDIECEGMCIDCFEKWFKEKK